MGLRQYKPTSAGRRNASVADFSEITDRKKQPERSMVHRLRRTGGRNVQGKITCRHTGGGHRKMYRIVDFRRDESSGAAVVTHVEYDPNRTCRIALLKHDAGGLSYILAPEGVRAGSRVDSGKDAEPKVGNCLSLSAIPIGSMIHNIEMQPGRGGQLCRSAGVYAVMNATEGSWAQVTLPSGEVRRLPSACRATLGSVGFSEHSAIVYGKAGRIRWMGVRPYVRGSAMNPVAHPMGGGEGRRSGGRHPVSPTGKLSKGGRTRNPRNPTKNSIVRRRRSVRYGQLKV